MSDTTPLASLPLPPGSSGWPVVGEGLALAADVTGDHPATGLWPVGLAPALAAFLAAGEAKVTRFTAAHGAARALFPDPRAFLNLNTPEDLAAAEAMLKGAA